MRKWRLNRSPHQSPHSHWLLARVQTKKFKCHDPLVLHCFLPVLIKMDRGRVLPLGPDSNISSLYSLDPSGTYVRCDAKAIGSGAEGAQGSLGDVYHKDISLKEATKHALTILKQVSLSNLWPFITIVLGHGRKANCQQCRARHCDKWEGLLRAQRRRGQGRDWKFIEKTRSRSILSVP